jgi:hypothetical protein
MIGLNKYVVLRGKKLRACQNLQFGLARPQQNLLADPSSAIKR